MNILRYLVDNPNLIAFDNTNIINNAGVKIVNNHILFEQEKEFFVYLDNFDRFEELVFDVKKETNVKIYLLTYQSHFIKIKYKFNLDNLAKVELFTNFMARRKTKADINLDFDLKTKADLSLLNALSFKGKINMSTSVLLNGIESKVNMEVLNIGKDSSESFVKQSIYHNEISTQSHINNWLIATDNAKLSYSVSGSIAKTKEFSKCHQSNKGIMLSDGCAITVEPVLLIDEYNVEASHGAAIGQMDELQLYYLQSRGLNEQEAKSLIISGYTTPFIHMIKDKDVALQLTSQISRLIGRKIYNE